MLGEKDAKDFQDGILDLSKGMVKTIEALQKTVKNSVKNMSPEQAMQFDKMMKKEGLADKFEKIKTDLQDLNKV